MFSCRRLLYEVAAAAPFQSPPAAARTTFLFRPSIAIIIGALTMFSCTFLLIMYAKHCRRAGDQQSASSSPAGGLAAAARGSGVSRAVVLSLPVFRFGALHGEKDGLECAVCLSRFEPAAALRLLPKCRHAFHVECVDTWLDAHSTCPLCRSRVHPEDLLLVLPADTAMPPATGDDEQLQDDDETRRLAQLPPHGHRVSGRHSYAFEQSGSATGGRRSVDYSTAKRKDGLLATAAAAERRLGHRIVVTSGGMDAERWSDLRPSDILLLRSEMIITDSGRFSTARAAAAVAPARSRRAEEERTMRRWLGFAALRTARWPRGGGGGDGAGGAR